MKKRWNWPIWIGFLVVIAGFLSYPFFARYPFTRDFPWANLLLFCVGGILVITGLLWAFGKPQLYRGKILGPILAGLSLLAISVFSYAIFYEIRQLPSSFGSPKIGQRVPEFTLPDQNGHSVALADLLSSATPDATTGKANGALLIFYRGHW